MSKLKVITGRDIPQMKNSLAAASFDSVISLALAYDIMLKEGEDMAEANETDILNRTLSQLQFNGLSVGGVDIVCWESS